MRGPRPPAHGRQPSQKRKTRSGSRNPSGSSERRPATRQAPARDRKTAPRRTGGWRDLFPVYEIDGPRIRLGIGWFLLAFPAVLIAPATAALLYGVAAGLAARQVVTAWAGARWQADIAGGMAACLVLVSMVGVSAVALLAVVMAVAAVVIGSQEPLRGLDGGTGRAAAAGVIVQAVIPPALAGVAMVLLTAQNPVVSGVLLLMASAYEVGDFIVGSGGVTPVEGPIAGGLAMVLIGFPGAVMFLEPFDTMEVWLLGVAPVAALFGQWVASAMLPRPDAAASALRRIDTLLVLGPMWVAAAGAF